MRPLSKLAIAFTLAVICWRTPLRADFDQYWNAIGAAGIADESSTSLVSFNDTGSVSIKSSVNTATAQLRYPVHPIGVMTRDLSSTGDRWCLGMQYRDTGSTSRVIVSLKAVTFFIDVALPPVQTLGTLDSKVYGDTGTDYRWVLNCDLTGGGVPITSFFTSNMAYFIDVKLIKTASDGNPGLKVLQFLTCKAVGRCSTETNPS